MQVFDLAAGISVITVPFGKRGLRHLVQDKPNHLRRLQIPVALLNFRNCRSAYSRHEQYTIHLRQNGNGIVAISRGGKSRIVIWDCPRPVTAFSAILIAVEATRSDEFEVARSRQNVQSAPAGARMDDCTAQVKTFLQLLPVSRRDISRQDNPRPEAFADPDLPKTLAAQVAAPS
jgi:hypothetical protein